MQGLPHLFYNLIKRCKIWNSYGAECRANVEKQSTSSSETSASKKFKIYVS
jgi:hypothetical protein